MQVPGGEILVLSARNKSDVEKIEKLPQWHAGTVAIEDFHRLQPHVREDIVDYLKYLADTEPLDKKLIIVGIPRSGESLVHSSFDLATRIDVFELGRVKSELVINMIEKGEIALNISFDKSRYT